MLKLTEQKISSRTGDIVELIPNYMWHGWFL